VKAAAGDPQWGAVVTLPRPLAVPCAVGAHGVGEVVAEHGDFLWKTLQRCGVRDADLADVLQEVLLVVHRQLATYDPGRPMPPWLFGICLRVATAHRRRAWVRRERPMAETPDAPDGGPDPEERASLCQARARLAAILEAMDAERRAVFVMFEIEEMGCEEIAAIVGVPVGTVWSRLHVARRQFDEVRARLAAREPRGTWR
jgi:RNA polymerase sigma-70 factor (ECF subfamily)